MSLSKEGRRARGRREEGGGRKREEGEGRGEQGEKTEWMDVVLSPPKPT